MAVPSYATWADYRSRNDAPEADEQVVTALLVASSRLLDRRLGWAPGCLAPLAEQSVVFWPPLRPSRVLHLRDAEGHLWPYRSVTSVAADYGGTGTETRTWEIASEPWILSVPEGSRPARALRMQESHHAAKESAWPSDPGTVTVTGEPGHDAVPEAVRELVVHMARETRDGHIGGAAAVLQALDSGVRVTPAAEGIWRLVKQEHSAGRLARLGVVGSAAARSRTVR